MVFSIKVSQRSFSHCSLLVSISQQVLSQDSPVVSTKLLGSRRFMDRSPEGTFLGIDLNRKNHPELIYVPYFLRKSQKNETKQKQSVFFGVRNKNHTKQKVFVFFESRNKNRNCVNRNT